MWHVTHDGTSTPPAPPAVAVSRPVNSAAAPVPPPVVYLVAPGQTLEDLRDGSEQVDPSRVITVTSDMEASAILTDIDAANLQRSASGEPPIRVVDLRPGSTAAAATPEPTPMGGVSERIRDQAGEPATTAVDER
jgi:hypothetical protein